MAVHTIPYATLPSGQDVYRYVLSDRTGMTASLTDLGATLLSLEVPSAQGTLTDVVLGYADVQDYLVNDPNLGTVVGRNANRIARGRFELAGRACQLACNEYGNSLHSGPDMWKTRVWEAQVHDDAVTFLLESPDGDQGFPGDVAVRVTYALDDGALVISYEAEARQTTVINLTNHSYFNLNGHAAGDVGGHTLQLFADSWLPIDEHGIPTGEVARVGRTPMDFREPWALAEGLDSAFPALRAAGGYDHNYCVGERAGELRRVARLVGDASHIAMDVETDLPGLQLYTANQLQECVGKDGATYGRHQAVCLETQYWPDAVNHADWDQPVFGPDRPYHSVTAYRFGLA